MTDNEKVQPLPPLEKFVETIDKRGLPIDEADARLFGGYILEHNPPVGLLERLLDAFQYVDEERFDQDLQTYSEMVKKHLGDSSYSCAIYGPGKSNYWIYTKLIERGLQPAERIFAYGSESELNKLSMLDQTKIDTLAPKEGVVLIPDDFAITGTQIGATLSDCLKTQKVIVALPYVSPNSKSTIQRAGAICLSVSELIPSNQWLTNIDLTFLQDLSYEAFNQDGLAYELTNGGKPLFWTWYKVPDSMFPILVDDPVGLEKPSSPPLIRVERFKQPYRVAGQEVIL